MKINKTDRGFKIGYFKDTSGTLCSIQESSSVDPLLWLGANSFELKQLIDGEWQDVEINPVDTIGNNRMLLSQEAVKELLPQLEYFAEHGKLKEE